MVLRDQMNRLITWDEPPKRIVSLVPSQTELLVDLGLEDHIVGLTKFCIHPADLRKKKTVVGGTKTLHFDRIRELNPDIILCNKEENTKEIIYTLEREFPVHISDVKTLAGAYEMIEQYGRLFSVSDTAEALIKRIRQEEKDFRSFIESKPKLKVAYFVWRRPWMVVGGGTFVNYLLTLNNFENVFEDTPLYPKIKLEEIPGETDLLLLSSEPFPFKERHKKEIEGQLKTVAIDFCDGEYFSWYGSRLEAAFRYFKKWRETVSSGL